jgi:multicomponent Na+:H+ antiporter subunit D
VSGALVLPVFVPLACAALAIIAYRFRMAQRIIAVAGVSVALADAVGLLVKVNADGIQAVQMGAWPAPLGITLVADLFSALMLVIGLATILAVLVYAIGQPGADDDQPAFHPVYLVLTAGSACRSSPVTCSTSSWPTRSPWLPATC